MKLDQTQEQALSSLQQNLAKAALRLSSAEKKSRGDAPLFPDLSNVFGILGPRGAGKSTLLQNLYRERKKIEDVFVLRPLDCSLVGESAAPGAAILLHLEAELRREISPEKIKKRVAESALDKLSGLASRHLEANDSYQSLVMDLSSSLGDYSHFLMASLRERLRLHSTLRSWLSETLDDLGLNAFLVLLDDFDLIPAKEVRRWILSLLDEWHQSRLLFVLTGDFHRLEHLASDVEAEVDDITARALVQKLLPSQNRVDLQRWDTPVRARFPIDEHPTLGDLIKDYSDGPSQTLLLERLLPDRPRGLVNLYQMLTEWKGKPRFTIEKRDFLASLASCRGEPLLSRELQSMDFSAWARSLEFDENVSEEDWQEMVEVAPQRSSDIDSIEIQPFRALRPRPPELSRRLGRAETSRVRAEQPLEAPVPYELQHDPTWRDPLRHDELRLRPLRDAEASIQPYWSELLIDLGCLETKRIDTAVAIRNRVHFLEKWGPASRRLEKARIDVTLDRRRLRAFFEEADDAIPRAALLWMNWKPGESPHVQLGWKPLLLALRGARDPLMSEQLADLLIGPSELGGELPRIGSVKELALLPGQLWAMILLVDGLDRCPWSAFSGPLGWLVQTYIALAAVLVRTAYVYALVSCGILDEGQVTGAQQFLLKVLENRDPQALLKEEEKILAWLREVLCDDLGATLATREDCLSRSALAFLSSRAYAAVVGLLSPSTTRNGSTA